MLSRREEITHERCRRNSFTYDLISGWTLTRTIQVAPIAGHLELYK